MIELINILEILKEYIGDVTDDQLRGDVSDSDQDVAYRLAILDKINELINKINEAHP